MAQELIWMKSQQEMGPVRQTFRVLALSRCSDEFSPAARIGGADPSATRSLADSDPGEQTFKTVDSRRGGTPRVEAQCDLLFPVSGWL
jgi:hypothetical protein